MLQNPAEERHQFFQTWLRQLFVSEINYFEADADIITISFAQIARMRGLESIAAGCVVQSVQNMGVKKNTQQWFDDVEVQLREMGCHQSRIYIQDFSVDLHPIFAAAKYQSVDEIALILPVMTDPDEVTDLAPVHLREISTENDWAQKLDLQYQLTLGPDGHDTPADLWIEMERRKVDAGYMTPYFICFDKHICGAVNLALNDEVARLKNLVIHPQWRRKSVGRKAAALFAKLARQHGKAAVVCFALHDSPSLPMYQQAGFQVVARQTEWLKSL